MARKAAVQNATTEQTVDYAAIISQFEGEITERITQHGEYLPWSWYKTDVLGIMNVLITKNGKTTTSEVRQYLIKVLEQKIEAMPKSNESTSVLVSTHRVEMTRKEEYELRIKQFDMAKKSTVNGPTITRILGGKGAREWLGKNNVTYDNGFWKYKVTIVNEEKSS